MAKTYRTCGNCVFSFCVGANWYCVKRNTVNGSDPIPLPVNFYGEHTETDCAHFVDGKKVKDRYAKNRNRLDYLYEVVQGKETMNAEMVRFNKELAKLEEAVSFDEWTLSLAIAKRREVVAEQNNGKRA